MSDQQRIAIVGMAARFPGAADLSSFWSLLCQGTNAVTPLPQDRRFNLDALIGRLTDEQKQAVAWGGFIEGIESFDAPFFGISKAEARAMDPKQRLALEVAWHALEDAAIAPDSLRGSRTGVFVGTSVYDYYERLLEQQDVDAYLGAGNFNCVVANRISYLLDLRGPSMAIETACSASLTALHQACASLRDGSSDLALAGGVMTLLSPAVTVGFAMGGFLAPDGRCKSFDDGANGYVRGEGAGMLVLRRLADAERDGDRIWAVIEGTVLNQDGHSNGLTAPNPKAQEALLREACERASVAPERIDYVEAHGTGTRLGDPIEVNALGAVLGAGRAPERALRIGSVKSNIGHLEAAAGIAGVIKTCLALHHGQLPPSLHFSSPNRLIAFDRLGVRVQDRLEPWPYGPDGRRWAGVSAFSFAGANAHVVLASAPTRRSEPGVENGAQLLVLSAKTQLALKAQEQQLADYLADPAAAPLPSVARSLQRGRAALRYRSAVVAGSAAEAVDGYMGTAAIHGQSAAREPKVGFLFAGQGAQFAQMAAELYECWPLFRRYFEQCAAYMAPFLDISLPALCLEADHRVLASTRYTQPAMFAMQWSLASALIEVGVKPQALLGHSIGEFAAAAVAGVMSPELAARAVCARAAAIDELPAGGGMCSVLADEVSVRTHIASCALNLHISAINAPGAVTVGGMLDDLQQLRSTLDRFGIASRMLDVSHAFHTPAMSAAQDVFARFMGNVSLQPARIPCYSSMTGGLERGAMSEAGYWTAQIGAPVRFGEAAGALLGAGIELLVEVGPGAGLAGLVRRCGRGDGPTVATTVTRDGSHWRDLLRVVARWYVAGGRVNWSLLHSGSLPAPVSLPGYPYQKQRHWLDADRDSGPVSESRASGARQQLLGDELPLALSQRVFVSSVGLQQWPQLRGHVALGEVILPGSAGLVLALEAAAAAGLSGERLSVIQWTSAQALHAGGTDTAIHTVVDGPSLHLRVPGRSAGEGWRELMTAQLHAASSGAAVPTDSAVRRIGCTDPMTTVAPDAIYRRLAADGLEYGAPFQALRSLELGTDRLTARISVAREVPITLRRVIGLDCALHPCVAFAGSGPYVPFALERLECRAIMPLEFEVQWQRRSRDSSGDDDLVLDGHAFDSAGETVARWEGMHLRRARALRTALPDSVSALPPPPGSLYVDEWVPTLAAGGRLQAHLLPTAWQEPDPAVEAYHHAIADVERAAVDALPHVLSAFGLVADDEGRITTTQVLLRESQLSIHRRRLLRRCIDAAVRAGHLHADSEGWVWNAEAVTKLVDVLDGLHASTSGAAGCEAEFLAHCLGSSVAVLGGRREAVDVLFQSEGARMLAGVYGESPAARHCNRLLAGAMAEIQQALPDGRLMRVLEVGAGTGASTGAALQVLQTDRLQYVFSDVSTAFMAAARERFAGHRSLRFQVFDLESDASAAVFGDERFDVIVAANVVHATRDIGRSLTRLRELLVPGGYLLLLEVTERQLWLDLTFGMTEGWWAFSDDRHESALLDVGQWEAKFISAGLEDFSRRGGEHALHQQVLVGRRPLDASRPAQIWRLRRGEEPLALCPEASRTGAMTQGTLAELAEAIGSSTAPRALLQVLESALPAHEACAEVAAMARALIALPWRDVPRLFVITRGGQAVRSHEGVTDLSAAAVAGVLRALDLEHPQFRTTLIDLEPVDSVDDLSLAALVEAELSVGDREREVAWRRGQRHVHRARPWEAAVCQPPTQLVGARGALDQLALVPVTASSAPAGHVRIQVRWSGLNFLDLLDAMGALPFDRPEGLGSECVGQIDEVGDGVSHLHVGDWVMAIAPGGMSSVVVADALCATRIPAGVPLDQAVGIPVAYVTALRALEAARLQPGDTLLVHAAAGATGFAAMVMARARGIRVLATASAAKSDWVSQQGAEIVFDSRSTGFAAQVMAYTDEQGVSAVINSLTSPGFIEASLACLARGGRFVELAKQNIFTDDQVRSRRADVHYVTLDLHHDARAHPQSIADGLRQVCDELAQQRYRSVPVEATHVASAEAVFRRMQRGQHVGKLALRWHDELHNSELGTDAGGSFLITGGTGGLGVLVAQWLIERGARHIVLASRRGTASPLVQARISRWKERGVDVQVTSTDVTDADALATLCARFGKDWPALHGVFHAAGVLHDGVLEQQDAEKFRDVIAPKLGAAQSLADIVMDQPLRVFVLFSSVAGWLGSAGQANHSAANAGLDALASSLRAKGVPAVSIAWGTVAQIGAAAELGADVRGASKGIDALLPAQALGVLEAAIAGGHSRIAAVPMRWHDADPAIRARAMFDSCYGQPPQTGVREQTLAPPVDLPSLPVGERRAALVKMLQAELSAVLGFGATELDLQQGFTDLGVDSLGAVELRNRLQRTLGVPLTSSVMFDHPNVAALAEFLLAKLEPDGSAVAQKVAVEPGQRNEGGSVATKLAAKLAQLRQGIGA